MTGEYLQSSNEDQRKFAGFTKKKLNPETVDINTLSMKQRSQISLDVKRTFREIPGFDHQKLEQVLRNVAHPARGNFPYFQGLNNLAGYFLNVFHGDEVLTYNFTLTIIEDYLRQYLEGSLEKVKVLVFILKRIVEIFFPRVSRHIHRHKIVDPLVVFSNWVLGLFTFDQPSEDEKSSSHSFSSLEDDQSTTPAPQEKSGTLPFKTSRSAKMELKFFRQVMDIFVAEGWVGFFKCSLVMLQLYESELLGATGSQLMLRLSNFPQFVFQDLERFSKRSSKGARQAQMFGYTPRHSVYSSGGKGVGSKMFQGAQVFTEEFVSKTASQVSRFFLFYFCVFC